MSNVAKELARKAVVTLLGADADITASSVIEAVIKEALDTAAEECHKHRDLYCKLVPEIRPDCLTTCDILAEWILTL